MKKIFIKAIKKYTPMFCIAIAAIVVFLNLKTAEAKTHSPRTESIRYERKDHAITGDPVVIELQSMQKNPLFSAKTNMVELPKNPKYTGAKTWENYKAISNRASRQYKLQVLAESDDYGFRKLDGRYLVAIGTIFQAPSGTYVDIYLENGTIIPCIVGDIKSDAHTDESRTYTIHSMCATEFICDSKITNHCSGDVSKVFPEWFSKVNSILVYEYNYFENGPTNTEE